MNWPDTTREQVVSAITTQHERINPAVLRVLTTAAMMDVHPREGLKRLMAVAHRLAADFAEGLSNRDGCIE